MQASTEGEPKGTETILLVEPDIALRKLEKKILEESGYRVVLASDGPMALRVAAEEVGTIDLVITDAEMPATDGPRMVEALRKLNAGIRVLLISGEPGTQTARSDIDTSNTQFFDNRLTAETLREAVRCALGRGETTNRRISDAVDTGRA